ncbi:hypothetical protein FKW77_002018 [Venturia effusa]|uniref:Uncharacterized protein n=1 Tax=Venturia effusa TaxID=50376 RepID=A0A517LPT5_9PEZI|nr:hypothetical protein FKW77_002018 [Venturia effusa]
MSPTHDGEDDTRQGPSRELRRRGDDEDRCEESHDDAEEEAKKEAASMSFETTKTKSSCSRLYPPPPPTTGLPMQPPSQSLGSNTMSLSDNMPQSVLPLSVSAFPAMSTGNAITTGVSIAATATTLSLNAPAITPPVFPSGARKSGDRPPPPIAASRHHRLSDQSKTALIAFGVITILGFILFTTFRCLKRKRGEASAYGDLETLYSAEAAPPSMSESATITSPPEAYIARTPSAQKWYLPPIVRTSSHPWSASLYKQSGTSQATEDLVDEHNYSFSPGEPLFPSPAVIEKALVRKEIGDSKEDPFQDPFLDPEEDEKGSVSASSTVKGFKTTPSWVDDQVARIGTAR